MTVTDEQFCAWWGPLVRHLRRFCPDPEDVASLALLQLLQAEAGGIRDPRLYLYQIAHNRLADRKRQREERQTFLPLLDEDAIPLWSLPSDPESYTVARERTCRALAALTALQRQAILLVTAGFDSAEVAEILGCTEPAVRKLRSKAYRKSRGTAA